MSHIDYAHALAPTRADWLGRRDQLCSTHSFSVVQAAAVMHTILGACPPAPVPPHHSIAGRVVVSPSVADGLVWTIHLGSITPNEADGMAAALVEHAAYARECPSA